MRIDASDPDATVIEHRPVFVPGFGLLFVVAGLVALVDTARTGSWNTQSVFGIAASVLMGGWLFLYTARRDLYRFDARNSELSWVRRSLLRTSQGSMPLSEIEQVFVYQGPDPDSGTYRVHLHTKSHGVLPLDNGFTPNEAHHDEVKQAIDAVLERAAA